MKIGFTGTRTGTTPEQHARLCRVVQELAPTEWHHGCCIGADSESVDVVWEYAKSAKIVAHPPEKKGKMSYEALHISHEKRKPRPYLERNRDIVNEVEVLVACPDGEDEELWSGTWATIRAARKKGIRIVIIWPDGNVTDEPATGLI